MGAFFWKIQIRNSESKNGSWLHKIHSQGGFSDQIQIRIFEIHNLSGFFLEKVFEKSIFVKELFEKKKW